ncbi:restriction endonuclease subunit M [Lactobacillus crispatus]|uniref:BREX-1 system adenine-specific DNA-methyltransferase PglX n=1 Tax=Lactobacillus TaxID=1578 RepID=UPI000B5DB4BA|nr:MULTISPECIES: BREX-1 system adenine-specific DNA-methyltransferase PglX [Lactobacillus]OXC47838.1 restriction endonuclease subunit M [Lactobacillus crispatus]OXC48089.1 restriction endonuclease subunit M [Lactobacillus crispatus]OXC48256.1 restriction endonuclease subunit M [Lactobacillus crispatus]OXC50830.1 restriction endonuclease subunit M [Lactobacillus crispatus]OXC54456.1 restriction endonuclease subunit M [Lactobacillus crispatus]
MDKNKIKKFAINARQHLRDTVEVKLAGLGITADKINNELPISTTDKKYYVDDNENNALTGAQIGWRRDIVNELKNRDYDNDPKTAFNDFVEEVAYTWFNRIIALRFMEVNNYLPSRVRVLTSEEGKAEPDIVDEAMEIEDDLGGYSDQEKELITNALTDKTPELMDQLYMMLFIKQCDALSEILPGLFEKTRNYLKLLFTPHYDRGVIQDLINEIPESYFDVNEEGQVQIIGWLYQYYNSEPKDYVIGLPKSKKYRASQIAEATQIFTPDWIVKYMVQNSLGKFWINVLRARHPEKSEKQLVSGFNWKYYMLDAKQDEDVANQLKEENQNLENFRVEDLKIIDPAMGSGHILSYLFDVMIQIYESEGFSTRDAAKNIIENNLYGLDIDDRAYQLGYFEVMMKYREYNRRAFRNNVKINVYAIPSTSELHGIKVKEVLSSYFDENTVQNIMLLINSFTHGKEEGSLLKLVNNINYDVIEAVLDSHKVVTSLELPIIFRYLRLFLRIAKILRQKYDVIVTNPPYMGSSRMNKALSDFAKDNFPDSKSDLFAMFLEDWNEHLNKNGYCSMVTMQSWMFLSSFEKMRRNFLNTYTISNLMHMENNVMGIAFGTAVTISHLPYNSEFKGTYNQIKLKDVVNDEVVSLPIKGNRFAQVNQNNFDKIPGSPIAYWASQNLFKDFEKGTPLGQLVDAKQGLATADNKRFLRQWFEVQIDNISFSSRSIEESVESKKKWFPYNKGGAYRKWYGNYDYVVNWQNDGYEIRHFTDNRGKVRSRPQNTDSYFKPAITWSDVNSGIFSLRYRTYGSIHDVKGMSAFNDNNDKLLIILGTVNAKIGNYIFKMINPTISLQIGNFVNFPFKESKINIIPIVKNNIDLSKLDWDAFETSWDFQRNPLLTTDASTLQQSYNNWSQESLDRFNQLKSNEEELNKIFIDLYGLQDELIPEEDEKEVSVHKADQIRDIKAFLSYFIGCVFGRYSLYKDGLAFAGGDWNASNYQTFIPNQDNIILLTDRQYFEDSRDIIVRLKEFLSKTFKPDHLSDNMNFIAQTLDLKKFEKGTNAEQIIRDYFLNDFYKDHSKIYQKRPIYWEFSSGRNKGFKALMYLHRYTPDQLAMVRHYLHDLQPAMNDLINVDQNLLDQEKTASAKSKYRKTISTLNKQMAEMVKYDQILDHLSQSPVDLDLDDGVLVNHDKLQQGEKLLSKL